MELKFKFNETLRQTYERRGLILEDGRKDVDRRREFNGELKFHDGIGKISLFDGEQWVTFDAVANQAGGVSMGWILGEVDGRMEIGKSDHTPDRTNIDWKREAYRWDIVIEAMCKVLPVEVAEIVKPAIAKYYNEDVYQAGT